MRITVGHFLLVGMAGVFAYQFFVGPSSPSSVKESTGGFWAEAQSWLNLFKTGENQSQKLEDKVVSAELNKTISQSPDVPVSVPSTVTVSENKPANPVVVPSPSPAVAPLASPVVAKPVVYRKRRLPRRRVVAKPVASVVKNGVNEPPQKIAAKGSADLLIGNYVRIELTSGKSVQGILQERSAKEIKLELPGMGPIPYSMSTIKSIKPME